MRKAQQLVEFVLILPIILVILLVILELGFAINARITLAEAVKISVGKINQLYQMPGNATATKQAQIEYSLTNLMQNYFNLHNMPYADNMTVKILPGTGTSQTSLVVANYIYYPVFILPNFFGTKIIPTSIPMSSFQTVNNALLNGNNYTSSYFSTDDLSNFTNDTSVANSTYFQTSILKGDSPTGIDGVAVSTVKSFIAFLVKFNPTGSGTNVSDIYVRLFNWWGEDLLPVNEVIDISNGHIWIKSPYYNSANWFDTNISYLWALTSLGFTQAVYVQSDTIPNFSTSKLNLANSAPTLNPGLNWCDDGSHGTCTNDITCENNLNKQGLSFILASGSLGSGTYDSINDTSNAYNQFYNYTYTYPNSSPNYFLKLFIPVNNIQTLIPNTDDNIFVSKFSIDSSNGILSTVNLSTDTYDTTALYIDSDGDGIPDAWDKHPAYFDADATGNFDGLKSILSAIIGSGTIPDTDTGDCSSPLTTYIVSPYNLDGSLNSIGHNYIPALYPVYYIIKNESGYNTYYYCSNNTVSSNIQRKMPFLNAADETYFINAVNSSGNLILKESPELKALLDGYFYSTNKVTH